MRITLLVLLLLVAGCGPDTPAAPSSEPRAPDAGGSVDAGGPSAAAATGSAAPVRPVDVVVTGVPVVVGDRVVWCPGMVATPVSPSAPPDCAGIDVVDLTGAARADIAGAPAAWRVAGTYDGRRVRATGRPEPAPRPDEAFTAPCDDLWGAPAGNVPPAATDAVDAWTAAHPDRAAGTWWDSAHAC